MKARTLLNLIVVLFLLGGSISSALAQPPAGGGPGGGFGPGPHHPHFDYHGPGPRHGHGLPDGAHELWVAGALFFVAAGTYYLWNAHADRYETVDPPPPADVDSYRVIAYPDRGQSSGQQSKDRYACHEWAVDQSGFDPSTAASPASSGTAGIYLRSMKACLKARGYTVE